MFTLYQFPISHYCEKVRWALDYKKIEYEERNLLPGFHVLTTKKLATDSSLPILVHDGEVVQGSGSIITYLDEKFPARSLTPENSKLKAEALEWEQYVDNEIGIPVRRTFYHILLDYPDVIIPLYTQKGPWYGKIILTSVFPILKKKMRDLMDISQESAQRSRHQLIAAVDKLYSRLQEHEYLVANQFTRADLAAASLLAPLYRLDKYGLNWPGRFPEQLEELIEELRDKTGWVVDFYERDR